MKKNQNFLSALLKQVLHSDMEKFIVYGISGNVEPQIYPQGNIDGIKLCSDGSCIYIVISKVGVATSTRCEFKHSNGEI